MNHKFLLVLLLSLSFLSLKAAGKGGEEPVDLVNPFIGTSNFGTTNPGAVCPNGLMSVVPFNVMGSDLNKFDKDARWWSTPYEYHNVFFTGYSHVNLSGVGCPEVGSLLLMPTTGKLNVDYKEYGSTYDKEVAHPGYYSNHLVKYNVKTEVTATPRSSVARFTFPKGESHILLNLGEGLTNETGAMVKKVSDTEYEGVKLQGTFCYNPQAVFPIYFVMRVSKKPTEAGYWKKQRPMTGVEAEWDADNGKYKLYKTYHKELSGDDIGVWMNFNTEADEQVEVQMGVSFVSMANARENLDTEQHGKNFDAIRAEARAKWNDDLSRILVEGGTKTERTNRQRDMIRSMIGMYEEHGWMPKWELFGRETYTMEGDPAIPVITDSWLKGLRGYDINKAYEAFRKSALTKGSENPLRPDNDEYMEKGYVALHEQFDNSVSHALEYYIADNALSRLATALGKKDDARLFHNRALGYRHYFSKEFGLLRPLMPDGTFYKPFDPKQGENFEPSPGFHEGNAWNYTFYVPHDVMGLAKLMGGQKNFVNKLQSVFDKGYYDPANEPDIAYPHLFSYFKGDEWRTQVQTRRLLKEYFKNAPEGIPGNDDTGTMSAWAVFNMIGFYPDCPGDPSYTLTSPVFDKVTIRLDKAQWGRDNLVIETVRPNDEAVIIKKMELGGKPLNRYRITNDELLKGGTLKFYLK